MRSKVTTERRVKRGRTTLIVGVVSACCLALSACGSDSDDSASGKTSSLTVSLGAVGAYMAPLFVASSEGFWKDHGLDVKLQVDGANVITLVVGGRSDLGAVGVNGALVPVQQGKETAIAAVLDKSIASGIVGARDGIDSLADCKRVVTFSEGSASASWAHVYNDQGKVSYKIQNIADPASQVSTVTTGQADCVVSSYSTMKAAIDAGKLHVIVDPSKPETVPSNVNDMLDAAGVGVWGLSDHIREQKTAMVKFQQGLRDAGEFIKSHSSAEIADSLLKNSEWKSFKRDDVIELLDAEIPYLLPNGGQLTEDSWKATVALSQLDPKDPKWDYTKRVDVTAWKAANG